jgi:hypothetical protein
MQIFVSLTVIEKTRTVNSNQYDVEEMFSGTFVALSNPIDITYPFTTTLRIR